MLIDWDEANRQASENKARLDRRRAALQNLSAELLTISRKAAGLAPGVSFVDALEGYTPKAVNTSAADRRVTVGDLFNDARVRQAIGRELTRLDDDHRGGFVSSIADELDRDDRDPEAARKLRMCGDPDWYAFGVHVHPAADGDGAVMVKAERRRCWLRICPKCAKDHAARLRLRYEGRIQKLLSSNVVGCRLKMLVLTLPRSDDLVKDLRQLHACTKKLVRHFWGARGQGAFATAEVGPKGGNVHVHAIVYGAYVAQAAIASKWLELTGNASVVWVQACTPSQAVREGIKYISKLAKRDGHGDFIMGPQALAELHLALKGRRRVWAWGAFYGLADADSDKAPDDAGAVIEPNCRCGDPMVFFTALEARAWLHLKGAINCTSKNALVPIGPPATAPP